MEYSLNAEVMQTIPFEKYEQDFIFIVNGKEFNTNRLFADILSPIIREAHYYDSTFNNYTIKQEDLSIYELNEKPLDTYFEDFLKLGIFTKYTLDPTRQKYFAAYFYALGNIKEYFRLNTKFFDDVTTENVIEKIQSISALLSKFGQDDSSSSEIYRNLIQFASNHFEDINKDKMKKLSIDNLELIIKNENLQLINEDSLMEFIISLYDDNHKNAKLFENVLFCNLSVKMIEKFITTFNIEFLDWSTWNSISKRLLVVSEINETNTTRYKRNPIKSTEFKIDPNNNFNGILKYLSDKTNGNILENGTVGITTNSVEDSRPLKNLVDFKSTNYYRSSEDTLAIITFDFRGRSVQLTNYSIQTGTWDENQGHLKDWVIEGSFNGNNYYEIDVRSNNSSLRGKQKSATFEVKNKNNHFYQFIRLRQTGPASWNSQWNSKGYQNRFEITNIDFYGYLNELPNQ